MGLKPIPQHPGSATSMTFAINHNIEDPIAISILRHPTPGRFWWVAIRVVNAMTDCKCYAIINNKVSMEQSKIHEKSRSMISMKQCTNTCFLELQENIYT